MDGREDKDAQKSSTENPSVAPGAIFTPQEELIEVEETTPTVEPPAVIQPIPVNPNATVSTGTGDIKLPGEKKSHKKIWIVFVIVALLGVIAAGVVFAITNDTLRGSNTNQVQSAKKAFDQYATYILFGEARDELTGEFSDKQNYRLSREVYEENYDESYWATARNLLANAIDEYSKVKDPTNAAMVDLLADYQRTFSFIETYKKLGDPSVSQLINVLLQSGPDAAKESVRNYYADLTKLNQHITEGISSQLIVQYQAYVDLLDFAQRSGCIGENKELDAVCAEAALEVDSSSVREALASYDQAELSVRKSVQAVVYELERRCWTLSQQFEAVPNTEDDTTEGQNG